MVRSIARWIAIFCLVLAIPALASGDGGLLPPDGFSPGWTRDGAPKVYEGDGLYDHIDGGGEVFLELGFEACTVQRYRKGSEEFTFEVYRMADPAAALGIYLAQCGRETPDKAFAERHTVGKNQLLLVKGRYYLVATSPEASPGLPSALVAAAKAASANMAPAGPPAALGLLPEEGLVPGSLRILRGPIGLQAIVTLGEGDILLLKRSVTAVAGDFRGKGGTTSLIVAEYPDAASVAAALKNLRDHMDPYLTVEPSGAARLLWKDHNGLFGTAAAEGNRLRIETGLSAKPAQ